MSFLFFPPLLTDAPSFAEPGDALLDKVANTKVVIPCPAEGTTWVSNDSAAETEQKCVISWLMFRRDILQRITDVCKQKMLHQCHETR